MSDTESVAGDKRPREEEEEEAPPATASSAATAAVPPSPKRPAVASDASASPQVRVVTTQVSRICSLISVLTKLPNTKTVFLQIDDTGMSWFARPQASPLLFQAYLNRTTQFSASDYQVSEAFACWVAISDLAHMAKQLSQGVDHMSWETVPAQEGCDCGFRVQFMKESSDGAKHPHSFTLFRCVAPNTQVIMDMGYAYQWTFPMASKEFAEALQSTHDKSKMIRVQFQPGQLSFESLNETMEPWQRMTLDVTGISKGVEFYFEKGNLKPVTHAKDLNRELEISYPEDDVENRLVQFYYDLGKGEEEGQDSFLKFEIAPTRPEVG